MVPLVLKKGFQFPEPLLSSWNSSNPSSVCSWAGIECAWGRVVSLDLTNMNMCGSVSPQISRLDRLTNLSLAGNNFTGSIEMANLSDLLFLNISNNQFNGHLDWNYASISNLEVLDAIIITSLLYCHLGFYGTLVGLEYLSLAGNDLQGNIPGELGKLIKLREIYLGYYNVFEGSIPLELGNLLLDTLYLHLNQLWGPIPKQLGNLTNLVNLDLSHNALTGEIPSELVNLKQLRLFNLFMNRLHGSIPDYVADLPNLETLGLWMNNFTGVIPENLGQNGKLQLLDLSSNKLTGTIPRDLCASNQLRSSGPIPASLGELRQVLKLDLSRNLLSGIIPPVIGNCVHLTYLDMSRNNLSGSIPPEISNVHILSYLNVSRNHFSQAIPRSIGSMKSLTVADFSFNDFSGKLPESGQFAVFNASSFAGNPQLCGSLPKNPCNFSAITRTPRKAPGNLSQVIQENGTDSWKMTTFPKLEFTAADILECITDGNVIGRGGAGIVYHGKMPNGTEFCSKNFLALALVTMTRVSEQKSRHLETLDRNIVSFTWEKGAFLGWNLRCKIAAEAAKGLCYLHHDCSPLVIHRDVKSNNILLNATFEAHVADFGLAKFLIDGAATECMSAIAGSYGYIAPEYAYTLRVDEKSDVCSFGVVLLELITGRRPVGGFSEGVDIVQWMKGVTKCQREVIGIVDPRLTSVPKDESMLIVHCNAMCTRK
ncbi:leucine-rich repeat receptor-like serine/threonine-protein kinase BAM3 [Gossypium australe]|uniref:Leucine-rich repeat receptor-like serine/threonine-protein kinase BAM3 n=1 Tax=Gossypium australe TaxID=47621 RepID=A0A5B6US76_9ROSI|nr:leucine-rich repeat receptor-like serine/threonine-protein kinase BAM3 [Gossypium australe]